MPSRTLVAALAIIAAHKQAGAQQKNDYFVDYARRIEGVTIGAGDAKEMNAAAHIADPWPPLARDRRIPGSGERMTRTIRRYQDVTKLKEAAPALSPEAIPAQGLPAQGR